MSVLLVPVRRRVPTFTQSLTHVRRITVCLVMSSLSLWIAPAGAQTPAPAAGAAAAGPTRTAEPNAQDDDAQDGDFVSALDLIPQTAAGVVRIPDLPAFCVAWRKTHLGQLVEEPSLQPFIDAQRERTQDYLESLDARVGLRPDDLLEIASGEVVAAWLPFDKDLRRPYSLCVIADIRGREAATAEALEKIDEDLKAGNATRVDTNHRGQSVSVYTTKPKPGQLKIEQVAITHDANRIIAADRDTVVFDLLDALAGEPREQSIRSTADYQTVMQQSREALQQTEDDSTTDAIEWFARPFPMGRIIRNSLRVDRGNQVDILKLLSNQGFDAIKAAGGIAVMAGETFDLLHRGHVLAPPTATPPARYKQAAEILNFSTAPLGQIPSWVPSDVASFSRLYWDMGRAFWASESLINEAFGDDIFRPMIEGIRDDEEGPQIDLEKNVLPNLDDQLILVTDNTLPASIESERMLVAIRVKNAEAIGAAIRKAMEVEPDATRVDEVPGVEIWRVERSGNTEEFSEFFDDLGFEDEAAQKSPPPLLEHWAIALVDQGPGSDAPYIMFSSHSEMLVAIAKRIREGGEGPSFASSDVVQEIVAAMKSLGATEISYERVVRSDVSLRTKYELLRQGRLKESDSVLAAIVRRLFEDDEEPDAEKVDAGMLPPFEQIQEHFRPGGGYIEMTQDGMRLTGFLLK